MLQGAISVIIYLYKKTHTITGLKYLGKTTSNPHKYKGSGTYWKRHLRVHGNLVETEIIKECQTHQEIQEWGRYYSELWDIVASKEWANMRPEEGGGGDTWSGQTHTIASRKKISEARKGMTFTEDHITNMRNSKLGKSWGSHTEEAKERIRKQRHTDEFKQQLSEDRTGAGNPNFGKKTSEATKEKLRAANKGKGLGRIVSAESREKMRLKALARHEAKRLKRLSLDPQG
jgi:hypothetical protein